MADVTLIHGESLKNYDKPVTMRVAAYCRVSTDQEDQLASHASQIRYYTDYINAKPGWKLVDIYADEAITGTLVYKRDNFLRFIADCEAGKIDLVITKSISRFARNALDVLKYVRQLAALQVKLIFEEENIDTLSMDNEMVLSVLSAVYQQEVHNISANVKKGLKMKMSRGELVGYAACLGYDYNKDTQTLSINEKEAELVRYIFKRYCDGAGATRIAQELNDIGATTKHGKKIWRSNSVTNILLNEKYVGDVVQGKTYIVDPITKKRANNRGERDKYVVTNDHPGIVSREVFKKAMDIRQSRVNLRKNPTTAGALSPQARQYAFSHMMTCGFCGALLIRRHWNYNSIWAKSVWLCNNHIHNGKDACPLCKGVRDDAIQDAFIESFNRVKAPATQEMVEEFLQIAKEALSASHDNEKYEGAKKKIKETQDKIMDILNLKEEGFLDEDSYKKKFLLLNDVLIENKKIVTEHEEFEKNQSNIEERLHAFRRIIESEPNMTVFSREIFERMVDKVVVGAKTEDGVNPYMLKFIYVNGMEDFVDASSMHGGAQGKKPSHNPISDEKKDIPFNGKKDALEKQKNMLQNLLDKGIITKRVYNQSLEKMNKAEEQANKVRTEQRW